MPSLTWYLQRLKAMPPAEIQKVVRVDGHSRGWKRGTRYREVTEFSESNGMDNVEIVGFVARDEMADRLRDIDVGIVPMFSTSIPNKVFDYIASSTPLLVLGENDSADFVRDHDIGWSVSCDEHGIGEFLDSVSREDIAEKMENVVRMRDSVARDPLQQKILELIQH